MTYAGAYRVEPWSGAQTAWLDGVERPAGSVVRLAAGTQVVDRPPPLRLHLVPESLPVALLDPRIREAVGLFEWGFHY